MDLETLAIRFTTQGEAQVQTALHGVTTGADALQQKFVQLIAVIGTYEFWDKTINKAADTAVALDILSQKTGETIENLSRLRYAAELSHIDAGTLDMGLKFLARSMQQVSLGTGPAAETFKVMGVATKDAAGHTRSMTDVLMDTADKFASYKDGADKSALALNLFGRNGLAMIPMLNEGRDGIKKLAEESDRLGNTMSEQEATTLIAYHEQMKRLEMSVGGFAKTIAVAMVPALTSLAGNLMGTDNRAESLRMTAETVTKVMAFLSNVIIEAKIALQGFWNMIVVVWTFVTEGLGAAKKKLGEVGDEMLDANDKAASAMLHNRLIMAGHFEEIAKGTETVKEHNKALKDAPTIGGGKDGKDDAMKRYLDEQKRQIDAMKGKYDFDVEQAGKHYDVIAQLDAAYLVQVISIYGADSKEYYDQLKLQAQHAKEAEDEKLKWKKWGAEQAAEVAKIVRGMDEAAAAEQQRKAQEYATATANVIEATFRGAFQKGGGLKGALSAFGDTVLSAIGGIFVRMGETYVAASGILTPLAALLTNPFTAGWATAAYGAALIALGASLSALAGGGSGGGGSSASRAYGGQPPASYPTTISFGPNSATTAAGMTPVSAVNVTVIGPNDPTAQRQITELITKAQRRGSV